ncbi:NmrA-domain-containing protein, partial [Meredithblackwellia eburnea MCA 4105]
MVASTSPSAPLISIVGITGTQGGSVAQHIIKSKTEYRLRGLTRDILKNSAQTWVNEGVELVQADINSSEDLKKAFAGATYVFAVTNFFETMDKDKEAEQGKRLVDAAKAAQVKLLVWSGLEDITKASHGKYPHVAFFDSKAIVTEYAKSVGIPLAVVTGGFFMSNLQTMMVPQKQEDGTFLLTLPISKETPMAVINASKDFGAFVVSAIE